MNRFVRAVTAAAFAVGGVGSLGCVHTGQGAGCATGECGAGGGVAGDGIRTGGNMPYDPCYPERYSAAARGEVLAAFGAQAYNGHVLNQTIWNWYFEAGSDRLTPAGRAKLDSISQVRPGPDPRLYLQVARDVPANAENMDSVAGQRDDLTAKRVAAVQKYMGAQPAIHPVAYEIYVHDPDVPGIPAVFAAISFRGQALGYRGGIGGGAGTTATSTGGGGQTPAASAIGTGVVGSPSGPPAPAPGTPGTGGTATGSAPGY